MRNRTPTPEHKCWSNMLSRCRNPKATGYPSYGGRGIVVCERWLDFAAFLEDMGTKPTPDHSIDRIDVNGNYEPGNCRWATETEQQRNKRSNRFLTACGETLTIMGWADKTGLDRRAIEKRLKRGWSPDRTVTTPNMRCA